MKTVNGTRNPFAGREALDKRSASVFPALTRGITEDKGRTAVPAGFTFGGGSHEAVIRFPKESGQKPVYVSV
ncbi:colicin-like bacteriocin tRNase domain-containing protein, partial [Escherichia coli]|uniref:colicin-like bacteriocin tRNase domain-containing protein n=1 Tax=Escherichia coli TaxID=562 RepID=UPI003EE30D0C